MAHINEELVGQSWSAQELSWLRYFRFALRYTMQGIYRYFTST